jgi:hypothetical protein
MEAINYARLSKIDVVLVDTAGRMQVTKKNLPRRRKLVYSRFWGHFFVEKVFIINFDKNWVGLGTFWVIFHKII